MSDSHEEVIEALSNFGMITSEMEYITYGSSTNPMMDKVKHVKEPNRKVKMKLVKSIPSYILVGSKRCWVKHPAQVRYCARCNRPRMECPGDGDAKECDKKKGEERKLKDCWPDVIRNALPLNNSEKLECDYLEISGFGNETTDEVYHYVKNCAMVEFPRKVIKRTETVGLFRVVTDRTKVEQMETAAKVIREVNGRVRGKNWITVLPFDGNPDGESPDDDYEGEDSEDWIHEGRDDSDSSGGGAGSGGGEDRGQQGGGNDQHQGGGGSQQQKEDGGPPNTPAGQDSQEAGEPRTVEEAKQLIMSWLVSSGSESSPDCSPASEDSIQEVPKDTSIQEVPMDYSMPRRGEADGSPAPDGDEDSQEDMMKSSPQLSQIPKILLARTNITGLNSTTLKEARTEGDWKVVEKKGEKSKKGGEKLQKELTELKKKELAKKELKKNEELIKSFYENPRPGPSRPSETVKKKMTPALTRSQSVLSRQAAAAKRKAGSSPEVLQPSPASHQAPKPQRTGRDKKKQKKTLEQKNLDFDFLKCDDSDDFVKPGPNSLIERADKMRLRKHSS